MLIENQRAPCTRVTYLRHNENVFLSLISSIIEFWNQNEDARIIITSYISRFYFYIVYIHMCIYMQYEQQKFCSPLHGLTITCSRIEYWCILYKRPEHAYYSRRGYKNNDNFSTSIIIPLVLGFPSRPPSPRLYTDLVVFAIIFYPMRFQQKRRLYHSGSYDIAIIDRVFFIVCKT